jgi:hypothetical protein
MSGDNDKLDELFDDYKKNHPVPKHTPEEDKIIIDNILSKSAQDVPIEPFLIPQKKNIYSIYWTISGIAAVIVLFVLFYNDPKNTKIQTALNPIDVKKDSILHNNNIPKNEPKEQSIQNEILTSNKEYRVDLASRGSNNKELINLAIDDILTENKIKFIQKGNEYTTEWFYQDDDNYKLILKINNSGNLIEINTSYYKNKSKIDKFNDNLISRIKYYIKLNQ